MIIRAQPHMRSGSVQLHGRAVLAAVLTRSHAQILRNSSAATPTPASAKFRDPCNGFSDLCLIMRQILRDDPACLTVITFHNMYYANDEATGGSSKANGSEPHALPSARLPEHRRPEHRRPEHRLSEHRLSKHRRTLLHEGGHRLLELR